MPLTFFKQPVFRLVISIFIISASPSTFASPSFSELESTSGGRLGVAALDTGNHTWLEFHGTERFPTASTFKVMLVGAILKESMTHPGLMSQMLTYQKSDLAGEWNPVTEKHLAGGMSIAELCSAAVSQSDNTAANLLMKELGGPKAVRAFARSIGDNEFRLDRWEPYLNTAIPGDLRDTTTPEAMAKSLNKLALGTVLGRPQRQQLQAWLKATNTGNARIRAGVPRGWIVGDKTGTGDYGTTNDIGILWPPHCAPIVLAIYYTQDQKNAEPHNQVIAEATRLALSQLAQTDSCIKQNRNE